MIGVPDYLQSWIIAQRWFGGKTRSPRFEIVGGYGLADPTGSAVIRVYFILDRAENPLLYQVPLTERKLPLVTSTGADDTALVATTVTDDGARYIYDGPRDPAFAEALLRLILDDGDARETDGHEADNSGGPVVAHGHHTPSPDILSVRSSRVLGGEQSNTSIIFETLDAAGAASAPIICKLFRAIHDGPNPDVVLTEVLGAHGSTVAPRSIGHIRAEWPDSGRPHGFASGHLAFAEEFLPGVEDAWRVALNAAETAEDFTIRAHALGARTAEMHATLAVAMPSRTTTPADIATIVEGMRVRFNAAVAEVPELESYRHALEEVYRLAAISPWPSLQRVHGDFHLGQVLAVPDRGWVILDFEGEPLRPMNERSLPDVPLRDVAGMLRSFDYVAGSYALTHDGESVSEWASACRNAFLDGYIDRSGRDLREHRQLLDAFEIDKALYEAVYEARNRPDWLPIPTHAIGRLVARATLA